MRGRKSRKGGVQTFKNGLVGVELGGGCCDDIANTRRNMSK